MIRLVTDLGIRLENSYFAFTVGCYPDQGQFFDQSNAASPAEFIVYGSNSGTRTSASLAIFTLIFLPLFS